jgi:O-antigen/teichoic acid export membrane protein
MSTSMQTLQREVPQERQRRSSLIEVLRSLVGDSTQYLIGVAVMGLASMVLLPLYTRYLSQSDFGLFSLIEVLALGAISISGLGFNVSYLKWFAASSTEEVAEVLGTTLWVNAIAGVLTGTALWMFLSSGFAAKVLRDDAGRFAWFVLPLILLETLQGVLLTHLRARRRPVAFSMVSAIRLVAIVVFSIWLVAARGRGLLGVFEARVIGDLVAGLVAWALTASDVSISVSLASARSMAVYGLPVMASSLIMMMLDGAGRFFVNHYTSLEQVGLYAVAVKISGVMRLGIVVPFTSAWGGLLFQIAKRPDAQVVYSKIMGYLLVLSVCIALVFSAISPVFLLILATRQYSACLPIVPWLLFVQVIALMQYPASAGIYLGSATKWLLVIFGAGVGVSLLLNRLLVPKFGGVGAASAWLAAWLAITVLMASIGQRYYPLRYEKKPLLFALAATCLLLLVSYLRAGNTGIIASSILSAIVMLCGIAYVWHDLLRFGLRWNTTAAD